MADTIFLKSAVRLILRFNTDPDFRDKFLEGLTQNLKYRFEGRPIKSYVDLLAHLEPQNSAYQQKFSLYSALPATPKNVETVFREFYIFGGGAAYQRLFTMSSGQQETEPSAVSSQPSENKQEQKREEKKREGERSEASRRASVGSPAPEAPKTNLTATGEVNLEAFETANQKVMQGEIQQMPGEAIAPRAGAMPQNFNLEAFSSLSPPAAIPPMSSARSIEQPEPVYQPSQPSPSAGSSGGSSGGGLQRPSFPGQGRVSNLARRAAGNLGSKGQIAAKKGLSRGLGNLAKNLGSKAVPGLGQAALVTQALKNPKQTAKIVGIIVGIVVALIALLIFLIVVIITSVIPQLPGQGGGKPTAGGGGSSGFGATCATQAQIDANRNPNSCHYLNPAIDLFDTNIPQSSIDTYIQQYSPVFIKAGKGDLAEFTRRVNYIVDDAKQGGLNPAIFLGYWKSEGAFGTLTTREMGCAGSSFEEEVDCALAIKGFSDPINNPIANCARSHDKNSVACKALAQVRANSGFDKTNPITYPVTSFDDFAEAYGPYEHRVDGIPGNCTSTYNILLEVINQLSACHAIPSQGTAVNGPIVPAGEGGAKIASIAKQIASQLLNDVNDRDKINFTCVGAGKPGDPPVVAGQLDGYHCWDQSPNYDLAGDPFYLQCTELIYATYKLAGYESQIKKISGVNAQGYANEARNHPDTFSVFTDASQLQPGDIISLGGNGSGHVAIVVANLGNRVEVAQASTDQAVGEVWQISGSDLIPGPDFGSEKASRPSRIRMAGTFGFIRLKQF